MLFVYLAGVSFLLLIYPYVLYPLVLRFLRKRDFTPSGAIGSSVTRAALLFCAYNEERSLPAKILNIREIKASIPGLEVHVYTDGCTDRSVQILRQAADILTVHESRTRVGKASGMKKLVEATKADVLIFTDANVTVDPGSVTRLLSYFANPRIGTVAGTLRYTNEDESSTAQAGSLYWRLEESIKRLESETGSTMGADGSLFATRKVTYPHVPSNLLDDMISSISPLFNGYRVVSAPDVHAFEQATVDSGNEFRRKRRIACRAYNTHRYLRPQLRQMNRLDRFKYISHKHIRWFSAFFLMSLILFSLVAIASLSGLSPAVVAAIAATGLFFAGLRFEIPIVSSLTDIVMGIVATGIGVVEALAGRDYQTWVPARDGSP